MFLSYKIVETFYAIRLYSKNYRTKLQKIWHVLDRIQTINQFCFTNQITEQSQ